MYKPTKKDVERYEELTEQIKILTKEKDGLHDKLMEGATFYGVETDDNTVTFTVGTKHHVKVVTSYPKTFDGKTFGKEHPVLKEQYTKVGKRETLYTSIDK